MPKTLSFDFINGRPTIVVTTVRPSGLILTEHFPVESQDAMLSTSTPDATYAVPAAQGIN